MKSNQISIFIVLILSVVIGGLLYFLERSSDEDLGWSPNEMYGELGARSYDGSSFTNATLSGASNSGVALSMPHTSFSVRTRVSPTTYSQSPIANRQSPIANNQSPIASSPHRPIASSPISHTTSSAEYRSFGGGGNGNMGSAGTFRASAQSPISYSQSPIAYTQSPISQSPISLLASSPNSPIAPSPISNTPATVASGNNPAGLFSYALQTSYGTASYEANVYSLGSRNGVRGKQNAIPNFYDSWLKWLAENEKQEGGWGKYNDGMYTYTEEQLRAAWQAWIDSQGGEYVPGMNSFDAWWQWMLDGGYDGYTYGDYTYRWVPVGHILPLLLMAILYAIILFVKRNKTAQL